MERILTPNQKMEERSPNPQIMSDYTKLEWKAPVIKKMPTTDTYSGIGPYQDAEGLTSVSPDTAG